MVFVGRDSDREAATSMFSYLANLGVDLANRQREHLNRSEAFSTFRTNMITEGIPKKVSEKQLRKLLKKCHDDYILGFATALNIRLTKNRKQLETGASDSVVALIRREELAIEKAVSALGGNRETKKIGVKKPHFKNFFEAGYHAGAAVGIDARASLGSGS